MSGQPAPPWFFRTLGLPVDAVVVGNTNALRHDGAAQRRSIGADRCMYRRNPTNPGRRAHSMGCGSSTCRGSSGNMASLQLADFGAEVIKIEDPKKGDPLRAWQTDGVSVHWKVYSRNKKSVALSLRAPRGREPLRDLAATAHVLIENFRPGTLEAMDLGPDILRKRNPGLVIVRVSGWGQDGPYRDRPALARWSRACRDTRRAPALPTASRHCRRRHSPTWSPGSMARWRCSWHCARSRSKADAVRSSTCRCSIPYSRLLPPRRRPTG